LWASFSFAQTESFQNRQKQWMNTARRDVGANQPNKDEILTVSFCDVVNDMAKFDDKLIRIRAIRYTWLDGTLLYHPQCDYRRIKPVLDCDSREECAELTKLLKDKTDYIDDADVVEAVFVGRFLGTPKVYEAHWAPKLLIRKIEEARRPPARAAAHVRDAVRAADPTAAKISAITKAKQHSGEERVQQLLQTLEPDNTLRLFLQQGRRGDGVHYWWMDVMRTSAIKQAAFEIDFKHTIRNTDVKIKDVTYMTTYYRYDTAITDNSMLQRIRATGLEQSLESEILTRARKFLTAQTKRWSKETCGTLYMNLLDDEVLPLLDETVDREDCNSTMPSSSANRRLNDAPRTVLSQKTYERVLEIVFPRPETYDYVLRFEPSFAPEKQIVISISAGKTDVVEYTSLSGNIFQKLDRLKASGADEDADQMARTIEVKKRIIAVPADYAISWQSQFSKSSVASTQLLEERRQEAESGVGTVTIDGTLYTIWHGHKSPDSFFRQWDNEVSDKEVTGEFKLVQWMNSIRRDIAKLPATTAAKR
jgi:hypothetical protein